MSFTAVTFYRKKNISVKHSMFINNASTVSSHQRKLRSSKIFLLLNSFLFKTSLQLCSSLQAEISTRKVVTLTRF